MRDITLHFLSGMPRSGSTVLAAILNQNPLFHVSTTSGLVFALDGLANTWHSAPLLNDTDPNRIKLAQAMRGLIQGFYKEDTDKPIIIDKSRGWPIPVIMAAMTQILKRKPKIIATVRSVPDCMASFVRVAKPKNVDLFLQSGELTDHLRAAYQSLLAGYQFDKECFLFVEYDDLVKDPKTELKRIHKFLGVKPFKYDFNNIDGSSVKEDDEMVHGYTGMHDIKPKLEFQHKESAKEVLGNYYTQYCHPEFWLEKPRTTPILTELDLQLSASTMGNFEEGWRLALKLEHEQPLNHRAAFNRGWYLLRQGRIQEGYRLLDRGRLVGVFGNSTANTKQPLWDGKTKGTILVQLEGGLGDQFHQVRYAKELHNRGNKVVVSCSGQLVSLFNQLPYITSAVQHNAEYGVYHDAWIKGMSAVVPLEFELKDISGKPYIDKPNVPKNKKFRIGLRWQGNKQFEDVHHKLFPHQLFFDAVQRNDVEFISLQRDEGSENRPTWVKEVPLNTWHDTQHAIASCDLIISSCTSVSHLAGAMGVPTWVIIPVMPYFLYALDGEKTPYYDSFRLFRQKAYGDWAAPMRDVKSALNEVITQL